MGIFSMKNYNKPGGVDPRTQERGRCFIFEILSESSEFTGQFAFLPGKYPNLFNRVFSFRTVSNAVYGTFSNQIASMVRTEALLIS